MATIPVTLVPEQTDLAFLHGRDLPQKDNLCGAFWAALVLRAAGFEDAGGEPVDQDLVALRAGTTLPVGDPATWLPKGASPRDDYRLPLPVASDPGRSGTGARALARVVDRLSGGALAAIPVAGPWTAASVVALVDEVAAVPGTTLIANVRTGRLWGSRPAPAVLFAYLAGQEVEAPPPDWDVGHFVALAGAIAGRERALVIVRDTYRSLGWQGHHLQPAEAIAGALTRGDGREGGVLCVCPAEAAPELRERLEERFELRHWKNGTPELEEESKPDDG